MTALCTEMPSGDLIGRPNRWKGMRGLLLMATALLLVGCGTPAAPSGDPDRDRPLIGTEWIVESLIFDHAVSSIPSGTRATMTFHDDGSVSVLPGCNTGRGRFVAGPETVTVSDVILTRMACLDEHGDLEAAVLAVLETPELGVRIEAASLTLMAGDKGLRLNAR